MRLVFWHPFLSIHHAPLIRQLSMMPDMHVSLVARLSLENGRAAGGWSTPDYGQAQLFDTANCNPDELIKRVVANSQRDTLHLISDALFDPISRAAWQFCKKKGVPFGFISICPGMYVGRLSRILRIPFYRFYVRHAARAVNPILAISSDCRKFFLQCGFPPEHIYPWAYFVENRAQSVEPDPGRPLRLIYLGRLLKRKRLDILFRAFSGLLADNRSASLTLIGDGPERETLAQLATELKISRFITILPSIPHERVHVTMQNYDILLLPTECDDWGVVVNEALQSGLAVITTKNAGAGELIESSRAGIVCDCSVSAFKAALQKLADSPDVLRKMRVQAREYSENISPERAAQYLRAIAEHTLYGAARPDAPWLTRLTAETAHEIAQHCFYQRRRSMDDANGIFAADSATHLNAPQ